MKIQNLILLFGILCSGVSFSLAQPSPSPAPFVVGITNIDRERVFVFPRSRADGAGLLGFYFEGKNKTEIDELIREGVRIKRPVRIVDGQRLIAEGRVSGGAQSETAHRLVLAFDSVVIAERAATAIRESGPWEDIDTIVRRKVDDRRSWRF